MYPWKKRQKLTDKIGTHLAELLQVNFVTHQHQGNFIGVTDLKNELFKLGSLLEWLAVSDRVADDESFPTSHVLLPHGSKFCLQEKSKIVIQFKTVKPTYNTNKTAGGKQTN